MAEPIDRPAELNAAEKTVREAGGAPAEVFYRDDGRMEISFMIPGDRNDRVYTFLWDRHESLMTLGNFVRSKIPRASNMEVNSGVEGENTCECGRVWLLAKRKVPQRDKDDLSCNCGKKLVRWNGGCVWTAQLIKDIPSGA